MTISSTAAVAAPPGVAAVVVTYRRPRLAGEAVRRLLEVEGFPPERVILVINGEGGLDDPGLQERVRVVQLPENLGPAAGFREGMLAAAGIEGVRWCYLCEDDVGLFDLPGPRLGRLVADAERLDGPRRRVGAIVAYGRDLHRRTGHTTLHEVSSASGYDRVDAASWGASLVALEVLERGVLPDDGYFFEYEDFDFWYQMTRAGYAILLDRASAASVAPQMSLRGREAAHVGHRPVDRDEPWRAFYVARNYFRLARRHGSPSWLAAHLIYSVRRLQLAASAAERRAILHGLLAGVRGATGKDARYLRSLGELSEPADAAAGSGTRPARRKVLHVLPTDITRGAQVFARDLCQMLNDRGEEHVLLTLFHGPGKVLAGARSLGVPMGRLRRLGFDPRVAVRLSSALAEERPDVVVVHGSEPLKYFAVLGCLDAPLVYLSIGMAVDAAHRGPRRLVHRLLVSRADLVAAVSHETLAEMRARFGVPPSRTVLLLNGRDPSLYRPREEAPAPGAPVGLIFVGHLDEQKDPLSYVRAVRELERRRHAVRALLVGVGPLAGCVAAEAAGVSSLEVLGRRHDVAELMRGADVFVFTSRPPEGLPGVLIEAALSGLAIVATAIPGVEEVVRDGVTGLLVAPGDDAELVAALERLIGDAGLRAELGRAARRHAEGQFGLEAVAASWESILDLASSLPRGRPTAGASPGEAPLAAEPTR